MKAEYETIKQQAERRSWNEETRELFQEKWEKLTKDFTKHTKRPSILLEKSTITDG